MEVMNEKGDLFTLTPEEEKFLKAVKKLEKLNHGRIRLFANGLISVRLGGLSSYRTILLTKIQCEGGDGGDNFD